VQSALSSHIQESGMHSPGRLRQVNSSVVHFLISAAFFFVGQEDQDQGKGRKGEVGEDREKRRMRISELTKVRLTTVALIGAVDAIHLAVAVPGLRDANAGRALELAAGTLSCACIYSDRAKIHLLCQSKAKWDKSGRFLQLENCDSNRAA